MIDALGLDFAALDHFCQGGEVVEILVIVYDAVFVLVDVPEVGLGLGPVAVAA